MSKRSKSSEEWFKQADYDIKTAEAMFKTGRYIYTVFMSHLSIEKALKGLYTKNVQRNPPKTHDLNYLSKKINLSLPEGLQSYMDTLNDLSVLTRYPDEIETLLKQYNKARVKGVLERGRELLLWLKERL